MSAGDERASWSGLQRYLERDLWTTDTAGRGPLARLGIGALRLVVVLVRALIDPQLNLEATALVYRTLLSLVPLLAVAFSVLKAFGAQYRIEAVLVQTLQPLGPGGAQVTAHIVSFVDNMRVSVLGAIGFVALFYTVLSVIERVESALNGIWHVRRPRPLARKFSDYLSIVLVGPVLVFGALAIMASAQSYWLVQRALEATHLTTAALTVARHGTPFLLLVAAFTLLYRLLPYTRVSSRAALVGGVTAALLWHLAGFGFATFVAGSASYAAIYSGFAVYLVSLIWLQVAWLVVLTGGLVAYVHQYPIAYVAVRGRPSALLREHVGLGALLEITRTYLAAAGPTRPEDLARALGTPLAVVDDVVNDFIAAGLLVRTTEPDGVTLGRAPDDVSVVDVLACLREPPASYDLDPGVLAPAVTAALRRRDEAVGATLGDVTLRALATAKVEALELRRPAPHDRAA